jgi:subtilisin family serine protease
MGPCRDHRRDRRLRDLAAALVALAVLFFTADAGARERHRVIVRLDVPARPESALAAPSSVEAQRAGIAAAASRVAEEVAGTGSRVLHAYETLPYLAIEVDDAGLAALAESGTAGAVFADRAHAIALHETTATIGAHLAWNAGLDGAGHTVAVLDTGVDGAHPFLAGKVVAEACFSGARGCPNGAGVMEGPGAAAPCSFSPSGCHHGTHVAGIIAGRGVDDHGVELSGVAPGAAIVAVQVFSASRDCREHEDVPCPRTFTSDYLAALEWVYRHGAELGIAAVNLSFARGAYTSPEECDADDPATRLALENLRSIDIAPVVAAGNGRHAGALGSPACLSPAISVGAALDRDTFAVFSDRAWFLSFAAPGTTVTSTVPGGGFATLSGSSMAAPHVAGALAILRQEDPSALLDGLLASLATTGSPISHPGDEWEVPFIDLPDAIAHRFGACPCAPEVDNFCFYESDVCAMTSPGGYCDPDGDGDFGDGDWRRGFEDFSARCRAPERPTRRSLVSGRARSGDGPPGAGRARSHRPEPYRTSSPDRVP